MATEKKKKVKPEVKIPPKEKKHHYIPRALMLFGFLLIIAAANGYLGWVELPDFVYYILLLVAGVWTIYYALYKGSYKRRHEVIKKYI